MWWRCVVGVCCGVYGGACVERIWIFSEKMETSAGRRTGSSSNSGIGKSYKSVVHHACPSALTVI